MSEDKRYIVVGTDDFFQHIEDTTLTEDKHEGAIYNIYQVVNRLNEQDEQIKELQQIIDTIAKDYEESHGMDIRNAEWFTAW